MFNFKMTVNEALIIQQAQIAWYRRSIGRKGIKAIRNRTVFPVDINPDKPLDISYINQFIPRGGSFESLICHRPKDIDPTHMAMHDAIRNGKIYH